MKFHNVWKEVCGVYQLDPKRFKVEFEYEKQEDFQARVGQALINGDVMAQKGGRFSSCFIYDGKDKVASGRSYCNPSDQFTRVGGRRIAFKHALEALKESYGLIKSSIG